MPRVRTLAALIGLALILGGCTSLECPREWNRPLDRARLCGPSPDA